jgi:P pilus assembly chaperone PapD
MKHHQSLSHREMSTSTTHLLNCTQLKRLFVCAALLLTLFALTHGKAIAAGQLMVTPTRIVFEGNNRTEQVNLINTGSETGRFRISFVRRKMTEDGKFEEVAENEPGMYSDEIVRFSPRQVTLAPGQAQTVRLMLRKKRDMPEGEYRSHLLFQSLPDPAATDISQLSDNDSKTLSVQLIPIVGITIPVIVRQGELSATVSLSDFGLQQENTVKGQTTLSLRINREGNSSAYGDIRVYFTPKGGDSVVVGHINGVAVYTPLASRTVDIKLQTPSGFNLSNGELHITYLESGKDETNGLLAESRLAVP